MAHAAVTGVVFESVEGQNVQLVLYQDTECSEDGDAQDVKPGAQDLASI